MINNIIIGSEELKIALAEFSMEPTEDGFFRLVGILGEAYEMDTQFFAAFSGEHFQSIKEEGEDYLVLFNSMDDAELGPDTDLAVMDLDNFIGNVLLDEEMAGFVINPFSDCIFIDRGTCNAIRNIAMSGPIVEVMMDTYAMTPEERFELAESIEFGVNGFIMNKTLATAMYIAIAERLSDEPEEADLDDSRYIETIRARAMVKIGKMILDGVYYEKNLGLAKDYFRKAADLLDTDAMVELGRMEEEEQNYEEALKNYSKASMMGNASALSELARMKYSGTGTERDLREAYDYFLKASDQGVPEAFYYLGLYCEEGLLDKADKEKAQYWYLTGASLEEPMCLGKVRELFPGEAEEPDDPDEEEDEMTLYDISKAPGGLRS